MTADELARKRDRLKRRRAKKIRSNRRLLERVEANRQRIKGFLSPKIRRVKKRLRKAKRDATVTSERGLGFITKHEGVRHQPYNDSAGHCTVGVGHLLHFGACTSADEQMRWGDRKIRNALRRDVIVAQDAVHDAVKVPLAQHQFDALVSFAFNVGTGAFRSSTLLRRLNNGEYGAVPAELVRWVIGGPGLINRRKDEGELFALGRY